MRVNENSKLNVINKEYQQKYNKLSKLSQNGTNQSKLLLDKSKSRDRYSPPHNIIYWRPTWG